MQGGASHADVCFVVHGGEKIAVSRDADGLAKPCDEESDTVVSLTEIDHHTERLATVTTRNRSAIWYLPMGCTLGIR